MTEKRSDYGLKYLSFLLGKLKTCIILASIFSICSFPMIDLACMDSISGFNDSLGILAVVGIGGLVVLTFVAPLIAMRHLYTRPASDNILSLPIKTSQRFLCETAASFLSIAVPYTVMIIYLAISGVLMNRDHYMSSMEYDMFIRLSVCGLFLLLMLVVFNIFFITLCGRLAEAIMYPVMFNIVVPLFIIMGMRLSLDAAYGLSFSGDDQQFIFDIAAYTSPIACFVAIGFNIPSCLFYIIPALVFSAVFFGLAYLTYRRRPVENIGQPFVYKPTFIICSVFLATGAVVFYTCLSPNGNMNGENYAVLSVLLLIYLLVMEFINYKKINGIIKFVLKYLGVCGASALIVVALQLSDGFGRANIIPAADEINRVSLEYDDENYSIYTRGLTSADLIQTVIDEHKNILDNRAPRGNTTNDGSRVNIYYEYKDGSTLDRYYDRYSSVISDDFLEKVFTSKSYRLNDLEEERYYFEEQLERADESSRKAYVTYKLGSRVDRYDDKYSEGSLSLSYNDEDYKALINALETDVLADDSFGRHSKAPVCSLGISLECTTLPNNVGGIVSGYRSNNITFEIYDNYTNTIKWLKAHKYEPSSDAYKSAAAQSGRFYTIYRYIYEYENNYFQTIAPETDSNYYSVGIEAIIISAEEYAELLDHTVSYIKDDEHKYRYLISVGRPTFLDANDDYHINQIRESGVDGLEESLVYYENYDPLLINEDYYDYIDKLFEERYVFSSDRNVYTPKYSSYSGRKEAAVTTSAIYRPVNTTIAYADEMSEATTVPLITR